MHFFWIKPEFPREFQSRIVRELEADHLRKLAADCVVQLVRLLAYENSTQTISPPTLHERAVAAHSGIVSLVHSLI